MLSFKYRVYPTKKQTDRLNHQMFLAKEIYNILLEKSKEHYKKTGKTFSQFDMNKHIAKMKKERPEFQELHSQVLQNISKRISDAYKHFFRRVKEKKSGKNVKVGFPRFKSHVSSLTYPQSGFKFKSERRISLSTIGSIPIVLHRTPKGNIKTCTIKQYKSGKWYVMLSNELEQKEFSNNGGKEIGVDVGLKNFAVLSNGEKIEPPKFLRKSEKKLKKLHRNVSMKKKGSNNRRKAITKLARGYEKVSNQRLDFLHKLSTQQVNSFSKIKVENLKISNMLKNHHLAKSIQDASWNQYIQMLHYKAESAGCEVIGINPRNTSKECSECGNMEEMKLSKRIFKCSSCGLKIDRDDNAAINIAKRDTVGLTGINACGDLSSTSSATKRQDISEKQELYTAA